MKTTIWRIAKVNLILILSTFIMYGCVSDTQSTNLIKLTNIENISIKTMSITNMGDGSRIILFEKNEIQSVLDKLNKYDYLSTKQEGINLSGYHLKIIAENPENNIDLQLDGKQAQFKDVIYSLSNSVSIDSINNFFQLQFEKTWNIPEKQNEIALEKLIGFDLGKINSIGLTELKSGKQYELKTEEQKAEMIRYFKTINLHQNKEKKLKDWAEIEEASYSISLSLYPNDPAMTFNVIFSGNMVCLGTNYWYDIIGSEKDINYLEEFSNIINDSTVTPPANK